MKEGWGARRGLKRKSREKKKKNSGSEKFRKRIALEHERGERKFEPGCGVNRSTIKKREKKSTQRVGLEGPGNL